MSCFPEVFLPRELTSHKLPGLNDAITIRVMDDAGPGGASHHYAMTVHNKLIVDRIESVHFQEGPIHESGPNGFSNEALIAIVIDRLQCFQKGQFSCRENALALTKLEEAMHWLHHRTRERLARGVEGTSQK